MSKVIGHLNGFDVKKTDNVMVKILGTCVGEGWGHVYIKQSRESGKIVTAKEFEEIWKKSQTSAKKN